MTSHRSSAITPLKPRSERRVPAFLGALAVLVGLAAGPSEAQAQLRSGVASVALTAYAAPGVHLASVPAVGSLPGGGVSLAGMTVNTAYRIELRGTQRVVLLRKDRASLVPWDRVRALLGTSATEPVVLDLVVTPTL